MQDGSACAELVPLCKIHRMREQMQRLQRFAKYISAWGACQLYI
jgi:hypothetical protein